MSKFLTRSNLSRGIQAFAIAALLVTGMTATISTVSGDQAQAAAAGGGRGGGGGAGGGAGGGGGEGKGGGGDGGDGPKSAINAIALPPTYPTPKPRVKPVKIERNCSTYTIDFNYDRPVCKDDTRF